VTRNSLATEKSAAGVSRGARATAGRRARARDGGFTLLEMLVAVTILAILVGTVPKSFVAARALFNRSENWMQARLVAETVLNQELGGNALTPGVRKGTMFGREWNASLEPNASFDPESTDSNRVLLDVRVRVRVSPLDILEVETMRIGSAQ
jgi:type II secretion system protein I